MVYYIKDFALKTSEKASTSLKPSIDTAIAYLARRDIEPIMFLSRVINGAESRYWPIELELASIVQIIRKVRYIIKSLNTLTIIFIDYGATLGITKQTSLTTSSIDKMNLRLVRASDYLQRFDLIIRYKPSKQHIVPDVLLRLESSYINPTTSEVRELDTLIAVPYYFTATLVEISREFKLKLTEGYASDPVYKYIIKVLNSNNSEGATKLPFIREPNGLIFRLDYTTIDNYIYTLRRLYIPSTYIKDVLEIVYSNEYLGYARYLEKASAQYIRGLVKYIRDYIRHYPQY